MTYGHYTSYHEHSAILISKTALDAVPRNQTSVIAPVKGWIDDFPPCGDIQQSELKAFFFDCISKLP
jgi:hypothetical protein